MTEVAAVKTEALEVFRDALGIRAGPAGRGSGRRGGRGVGRREGWGLSHSPLACFPRLDKQL